MEVRLNYENQKTNSSINFFAESYDDVETFAYLSKMMIYQDNKVRNNQIKKLVNVLSKINK